MKDHGGSIIYRANQDNCYILQSLLQAQHHPMHIYWLQNDFYYPKSTLNLTIYLLFIQNILSKQGTKIGDDDS
jgi:hypothetical protein